MLWTSRKLQIALHRSKRTLSSQMMYSNVAFSQPMRYKPVKGFGVDKEIEYLTHSCLTTQKIICIPCMDACLYCCKPPFKYVYKAMSLPVLKLINGCINCVRMLGQRVLCNVPAIQYWIVQVSLQHKVPRWSHGLCKLLQIQFNINASHKPVAQ